MCTGIPVFADGGLIFARTMEFAELMNSSLYVVPAETDFQAVHTDEKTKKDTSCMKWTSLYPFIGPNFLEADQVIEGFNDQGFHVAGFYFPGYEDGYQPLPGSKEGREETLTQVDFATWALGTCKDVDDFLGKLADIHVCGTFFKPLKKVPPIHWIVQDHLGNAKVVECLDQQVRVFDNDFGVITNAPQFDWHLTNLGNYLNISPINATPYCARKVNNEDGAQNKTHVVGPMGQGSGMLGLPGDFTSPSRFVRAVALSQAVDPVATNMEGVNVCWNLINNVDIAIGTVKHSEAELAAIREMGMDDTLVDFTQWVSVCDLKNLKYYFRTYENQVIRVADLKAALQGEGVQIIPMDQKPAFEEVTPSP